MRHLYNISAGMMANIIKGFDRSAMMIIGTIWASALIMMVMAFFALHQLATERTAAGKIIASEPSVPKIAKNIATKDVVEKVVVRLKRSYPEVTFSAENDGAVSVVGNDGGLFRQWLSAVSHIDILMPNLRWTLREFCVGGSCKTGVLMKAVLVGEVIRIDPPPSQDE
jgi:hypothetical protein